MAKALVNKTETDAKVLVNRMDQSAQVTNTGRPTWSEIYTPFDPIDDIVVNDREVISQGVWSYNAGVLTSFYTSSAQLATSSSLYYYNIYNANPLTNTTGSAVQFAIAYGHRLGSGSFAAATNNNDTATRAVYSQYRSLLLGPADTTFTFNSSSRDEIYVININRARIKEKLDPGNWQLTLASSSKTLNLIDDSESNLSPTVSSAGRVFNIVSGSVNNGIYSNSIVFGLCYPDLGILVFDPTALAASASVTSSTADPSLVNNIGTFYKALSTGSYFAARTEEEVSSTHYFVRVKNSRYNFSNNPTFVTGSYGQIRHLDFIGDPKVYITTIGLYDDNNELLATAKLSRPVLKSFSNESLIKVKLTF